MASSKRALIAAATIDGQRLFDVSVDEHVASVVPDSWPAVGMAASASETLEFAGPVIPDDNVVGPAEFYTSRPGFWFGSAGVAACWFGGAVGIVNELVEWIDPEPSEIVLADLGAALSALEAMRHALTSAARAIDDDPTNERRRGQFHALVTRDIVHRQASTILERVSSAGGARPLCHDKDQSHRVADLYIYLSQHHGGADAIELGRTLVKARSWN